jgi:phosphate uptake regulator
MKRKLVQHGNTSLTVSLPKKWTDRFNLKKGDEIELVENDASILLKADGHSEAPIKKGILDISKLGVLTRRSFDAMYKAGYDEIEVLFDHPSQLKMIETAVDHEAMTFEIVKVEKNRCIVKNISEADTKEFDNLLRRTLMLLKVMGDDLLVAMENSDATTIVNIKNMELTNNKFTHFCRRALAKSGYKDYNKTVFMYTIVEQLETVADEFKFLCDYLIETIAKETAKPGKNLKKKVKKNGGKLNISPETIKLFEGVNTSISMFNELFFNYNLEKAKQFGEHRRKVVAEGFKILERKNNEEKIIAHYLINIQKMIFDMFGPVMALVL